MMGDQGDNLDDLDNDNIDDGYDLNVMWKLTKGFQFSIGAKIYDTIYIYE